MRPWVGPGGGGWEVTCVAHSGCGKQYPQSRLRAQGAFRPQLLACKFQMLLNFSSAISGVRVCPRPTHLKRTGGKLPFIHTQLHQTLDTHRSISVRLQATPSPCALSKPCGRSARWCTSLPAPARPHNALLHAHHLPQSKHRPCTSATGALAVIPSALAALCSVLLSQENLPLFLLLEQLVQLL